MLADLLMVSIGRRAGYPGFQFRPDGTLIVEVTDLVRHAAAHDCSLWDLCLWIITVRGRLGGAVPADLIATEAPRVVKAALLEMQTRW